jgi:hypothetical protein
MALCTYGPLVSGVKGSLGSVTFKAGACSGVLTKRRRLTPNNSPAQENQRRILAQRIHDFAVAPLLDNKAWETWGKSYPWPNAIGVPRRHKAFDCYCLFASLIDPLAETPGIYYSVPTGATHQTLQVSVIEPHAGGPFDVTVEPFGYNYPVEFVTLKRHLEYGPRNAAGRIQHVGAPYRNHLTIDYQPYLDARGIVLTPGERFGMWLWWRRTPDWPSLKLYYEATVMP